MSPAPAIDEVIKGEIEIKLPIEVDLVEEVKEDLKMPKVETESEES